MNKIIKCMVYLLMVVITASCGEDNLSPEKATALQLQSQIGLQIESKPIAGKTCSLMPSVPGGTRSLISKVNADVTECTASAPYSFTDQWTRDSLKLAVTFSADRGVPYGTKSECDSQRETYLNSQLPNKVYACWNPSPTVSMGHSEVDPNNDQRLCGNLYQIADSTRYQNDWVCDGAPIAASADTTFLGVQLSKTAGVSGKTCQVMPGSVNFVNSRSSNVSQCSLVTAAWFTDNVYKVKHTYSDSYFSPANSVVHSFNCDSITNNYNSSNFTASYVVGFGWLQADNQSQVAMAQSCIDSARSSCTSERNAYLANQLGNNYACWTTDAIRDTNQFPGDANWGLTNVRWATSDLSAANRTICKNMHTDFGADVRNQNDWLCADFDEDEDGVLDAYDQCYTADHTLTDDADHDGCDADEDNDDDNDGWSDGDESVCKTNSRSSASVPLDTDLDGRCDVVDTDDDNDGWKDTDEKACGSDPLRSDLVPADSDADGICDALDPVDDRFSTVAVARFDCDTCAYHAYKNAADSQTRLKDLLIHVYLSLDSMPADVLPLYIMGSAVDMNGNLPTLMQDESTVAASGQGFWTIAFHSASTNQVYTFTMDHVGDITSAVHSEPDALGNILAQPAAYGGDPVVPFAQTFAELIALPMADSSEIMNRVTSDPSYHPSPYSVTQTVDDPDLGTMIRAEYAASDAHDVAQLVLIDGNGVSVYVPDETEWVIHDFSPTSPVGRLYSSQAEWIGNYYGAIDADSYHNSVKTFHSAVQSDQVLGDTTLQNNDFYFYANNVSDVHFVLHDYSITAGQPWDGVTTSIGTGVRGNSEMKITVRAGRHGSTEVADWMRTQNGSGGTSVCSPDTLLDLQPYPNKLNFTILGDLHMTLTTGAEVMCQDLMLSQGHHSLLDILNVNNWWVTGSNTHVGQFGNPPIQGVYQQCSFVNLGQPVQVSFVPLRTATGGPDCINMYNVYIQPQ